MKQGESRKISDEQIILEYNKNTTLHETAVFLNMTTVSLWRRAKKLGLKWSEKKINWSAGKKIPLQEILNGQHPYFQTFKLKKRLIKEGIKENKCEICKISEWNGHKLIMQLDHIDGNSHNHKLNNLRMICPNCHSQTNTYCGKNK
jgi:hypothetical protein